MSKTTLAHVDGWTPLIDCLVEEYGVVGAAVFGRMWRYCQGEKQVCSASLSKIGEELNLNKSTVCRYAEKLAADGYLLDLTPELVNKPHTYADTGLASVELTVKAGKKRVALNNADGKCVAQDNARVALNNASVAQDNAYKERDKEETIEERGSAACAEPALNVSLKPARAKRTIRLCDDDFLDDLQARECYSTINVRRLHQKMIAWCEIKGKQPTRQRFLNWLNREDVPMNGNGHFNVAPDVQIGCDKCLTDPVRIKTNTAPGWRFDAAARGIIQCECQTLKGNPTNGNQQRPEFAATIA